MEMTPESVIEKVNSIIAEKTANAVSKEELMTLKSELEGMSAKNDTTEVKSAIAKLEAELESFKEKTASEPKVGYTLKEALMNAFDGAKDEIKSILDNNGKQTAPLRLEVKAVVDMSVTNTIGAGSTQVSITENTGIISTIRKRELRYLANVSVGRIAGNRALWIEELDEQGTPIMLAEGASKTQLSVRYEEATANVKKIAVYGKVTTEMLADLPQLVSYIENNLMKRMDIVLENQLFNGDGTGDNLKGGITYATAFSAGTLANAVGSATVEVNDYDVIEAVALQTELAFGMPNAIFVNPAIVARMKLTRDNNGQYIMPTFATANGLEVAGMRVIPTTAITGENFLGGDLSVLQVLIREDLALQIGLDGNDFTNNKKTMLLEKRLVQFASANDTAVLIKGAFNTAKALLQAT